MIALLPVILATSPIPAGHGLSSSAQLYVRMRAAAAAGDQSAAAVDTAALLAREPGNGTIAIQAYRQAVAAGDRTLAMRAAATLAGLNQAPPDAPLLFAIDAIGRRDWAAARAAADRLDAGRLFSFVTPGLRAWIAYGARDADPLAVLETDGRDGVASGYYPAQRALLLLALGRLDEAAAAVTAMPGAGARLKLLAAAALLHARRDAEARAMLAGDDDILDAARRRVAAGSRIDLAIDTAGDGVSELLTQLSLDLNRQQLTPVALVMTRMATFAAPRNSSAWIATGNFLAKADQSEAALAALAHVGRDDPFRLAADTLQVAILLDAGDRRTALETVLADARRPGAGAAQWGRVGDVYLAADRPADAAGAYQKAIAAAPLPGDLWTLWLQRGAALEQAGDWPAAKAALEQAHALAPGEPAVLNHLGYSELSRRENVAAAAGLIEQASRLRPDDPAITDSLGWAHFLRGDVAGAVPLLERASGADPAEPTINEHLGDVYWTAGRRIEARYAWRAALVTADARDAGRLRAKLDGGLTKATTAP